MTVNVSSLDKALSINPTNQTLVFTDSINSTDGGDIYNFTLGARSSLQLDLKGLSADADIDLILDTNNNQIVDDGEVIAYSNIGGNNPESITKILDAGNYYIRIYPYGNAATDYKLTVGVTALDYGGNSFTTAKEIDLGTESTNISDWLGISDSNDYYKFSLNSSSNINLSLKNLSGDADIRLFNAQGNLIASSANLGKVVETINTNLNKGTYYLQVYTYGGSETFYDLSVSSQTLVGSTEIVTPLTSSSTRIEAGNLRANTFTYKAGYSLTVFSGNGNVDYNTGKRDVLDLSGIASTSVTLSLATLTSGGVVYNTGDGVDRLFDVITLANKTQIYFENIDVIKFSDKVINLSVIPNDPFYNQQWNLNMTGVHNAWRMTTGSTKVLIGIGDTGIARNSNGGINPDLRYTYTLDQNTIDESSEESHGTLTQGIIAGRANNKLGITPINWNSPVRMVDVIGGNPGDQTLGGAAQIIINEAKKNGQLAVINLSVSGGNVTEIEKIISSNQDKALFVIAAGNGDQNELTDLAYLSKKYGNVISVGAVWGTKDYYGNSKTPGTRISYSDPVWWGSNYGDGLTLVAPSEFVSLNATRDANGNIIFSNDGYFNGTSASTAMVSGIASLVWSANPNLNAKQVKQILVQTAYDVGTPVEYGAGVINADAAIRRALAIARIAVNSTKVIST
ncbi:S8 family serine peptidase [Calothrix sp. 336/3]|uniref:S8 family serine peptidase n=1 Tax=Calothrix sp. 336/3 TaxID=1337936 RepID=UPI0004E3D29B|nr:S8 family serine peptidase [Calothrix sp. 336/3]AKG22387.1 hypothetical protein IJ00_14920 [Calothrix sp. 336/3]